MPDLQFQIDDVAPERAAAVPLLQFKLRVTERLARAAAPTPIQALALRCQVRIEPARRRHAPGEQERLVDLFGTLDLWGKTLRPLLWTHADVMIRPFTGATEVNLPVPCSYDFSLAATKYFDALQGGDIPLCFLFSGTIFYEGANGVQVAQVPWDREASFRLPAAAWQALMDRYYPNVAWLCLRKDVFDRLNAFKGRRNLPTWEQAIEALLAEEAERAAS